MRNFILGSLSERDACFKKSIDNHGLILIITQKYQIFRANETRMPNKQGNISISVFETKILLRIEISLS